MSSPPPIFTDTPRQHPNLIIGALHILAWIIFHPKAFRHHLTTLDPELEADSSWLFFLRKGRWRRGENIRFFLQSQIILPILGAVIIGCGHLLVGLLFEIPIDYVAEGIAGGVAGGLAFGVAIGVLFGVTIGVLFGVTYCVVYCLIFGWFVGAVFVVAFIVSGCVLFGVVFGVLLGILFGVAASVPKNITFGVWYCVGAGLMGGLVGGLVGGLSVIIGKTIHKWLILSFFIYPPIQVWNLLLYRLDQLSRKHQRIFLRWHSVGWCEWERLPITRLDRHLLLATKINPTLGIEAINYVSTTRQQSAAQVAQIEIDARNLAQCQTLIAITQLSVDWGEISPSNPAIYVFRIFNRIIEDIRTAFEQQSKYNQMQALSALIRRIDDYLLEFNRSIDKYTVRFRPILAHWQKIIADYIEVERQASELNQEIEDPYLIGVPLTTNQKLFKGRQDLGSRLEQLILDARRPPLLLYGQRRMGKTSLLNNLNRLLPSTIIPLFVDLQGNAASAENLSGFLYALAKDLRTAANQREIALPPVKLTDFHTEPIIQFNDWLDTLETSLGANIALLALDEFEVLDTAFQRQRLDPEDVLGLLRRLIQHRPKFKVLIAGSHSLAEYQRWSSYLINVQTLHISYLKDHEAKQLIERPIPDFPLQYAPDALELVLHLTHCHPYLVQLLCAEIIALKNEQDPSQRKLATCEDVEAAVPLALNSGSAGFFGDIQTNQVDKLGRDILCYLAQQGDGVILSHAQLVQQFDMDITPSIQILLQRESIEAVDPGYRFTIELVRRWFLRTV
jgi:hypothetical protein